MMTTVKLFDRPNFGIGGVEYTDAEIWDVLSCVTYWSAKNPLDTSLGRDEVYYDGPNQSYKYQKTRKVGAYHQPRLGPISAIEGFDVPDGAYLFVGWKGQFVGYGNVEDFFGPLFARGGKFLFVRVTGKTISMEAPISGGLSIRRDFLPGAALVITLAVTANAAGTAFASATVPSAAVVPSEWTIATAGMSEGMGTAQILATAAPAVPVAAVAPAVSATLPTLAEIGSGIATTVRTVQQTAASVVGVATAVNTVRAAINTPDTVVPQGNKPANNPDDNIFMYAGIGVLLLLILED